MPNRSFGRLARAAMLTRLAGGALVVALLAVGGQAGFSGGGPTTYVVKAGDNLWTIAMVRHTTVEALASASGLDPKGVLRIGTVLTIPSGPTPDVVPPPPNVSAGSVVAGDIGGSFCATFRPSVSQHSTLPTLLLASPSLLALRPLMRSQALRFGVSPALVEAIAWQESGWQQNVVSSASAVGIGQLLPSTAAFVAQDLLYAKLNIHSVADNIEMEARYLAYLQSNLGGTCATIAGYYEGLANMRSHGVLAESRGYVAAVEALIPGFE